MQLHCFVWSQCARVCVKPALTAATLPEPDLSHAAPPRSTAAPKKKVERTPNKPKTMPPATVADDNLPMASSLDMPLIQNNMLGARDATVSLMLVVSPHMRCCTVNTLV